MRESAKLEKNVKAAGLAWSKRLRERRGESGSALVEFALSAGLILALFFAVIEFGYALYAYQFVNEVAREMTRYAIVRGGASCSSASTFPNCGFYDTGATLQAHVRSSYAYPGINMSQVTVTTAWFTPSLNANQQINTTSGTPFTACASGSTCNAPGDMVTVTVSYPFLLSIPFWQATTLNTSSSSSMIISQ